MKPLFFPRDKTFWLLHAGTLVVLHIVLWLSIFMWQEQKLFNAAAMLVWVLAFSLVALFFRQQYQQRNGFAKQFWLRVLWVLGFAIVGGFAVCALMLVVVTPFFWSGLVESGVLEQLGVTQTEYLLRLAISNTLQAQLFLAIWMFIYLSVSSNRRIRETEVSNLRLQNSLKEAQLANLSNQLNPHFLFNAINNIRFTIYEDATKADTMLTGLSEMLRYSLERSKQDKVRLSEELEIIALYIDLIKVQMEDRLQFSLKVAPSLYNYLIPPMTLQLLVENAVKHGVDKLRHGGGIELTAGLYEQQLIFKVNNSRGDNKPLLSSEAASNNIGIGLVNIQERLRLLYGDKASMLIEQTSNKFAVTLSVPQEFGI